MAYSVLDFQGGRGRGAQQQQQSTVTTMTSAGAATGSVSASDGGAGGRRVSPNAYLWDISAPNAPLVELLPPSPLVCIRFNVKTPDVLIGGCYNGLVTTFDIRRPRAVVTAVSTIERSHHDPVYDVFWVQSKTNNQFVSVSTGEGVAGVSGCNGGHRYEGQSFIRISYTYLYSTMLPFSTPSLTADGKLMWWDTRKLSEPTDTLSLEIPAAAAAASSGGGGQAKGVDGLSLGPRVLGGSSMEYNIEAGE